MNRGADAPMQPDVAEPSVGAKRKLIQPKAEQQEEKDGAVPAKRRQLEAADKENAPVFVAV